MILLDTNMLSLFAGGHPRVMERVEAATDKVAITVVTQIEVLKGRFDFLLKAADGEQLQRAQRWLAQTQLDLGKFTIVPIDAAAAAEFDRLRQIKKLKKIGRADLLISSITLSCGAVLISRNLRHFRQVPGLQAENWAD